jgi:lysophospholipase L1-like esterase
MRPITVLSFILSVFLVLFAVSLFFPKDGIQISSGLKLRFVSPEELFSGNKVKKANVDSIVKQQTELSDSAIISLAHREVSKKDTVRANADSLRNTIHLIQFPGNNREILYPAFRSMKSAKTNGKMVHILHYGDSQIENDRITSFLRNKLQSKFGGMGIGLVPPAQVYNFQYSLLQENSDNWYRYTLYGNIDTTIKHKRFGPLAVFASFTPPYDSTISQSPETREAWVSFNESQYSYSNTKKFSECRMFYGYNMQPFLTEVYTGDELYDADMHPSLEGYNVLTWKFPEAISSLKILFKGEQSPEIYAFALESNAGIYVDNIPLRGSSGLVFTKIDPRLLKKMFSELDVKLLILQFGGNVVPNVVDNYNYYERWFYNQLKRLKSIDPDLPIIVIGVADMSIKEKDKYVSYPNIEKVRDALKNAAFKAGVAFWDMYEAMGGKNSMPGWVHAKPPLATSDYVHFNPRGAKIIAHMFYNALIYEYYRFEKQTGE